MQALFTSFPNIQAWFELFQNSIKAGNELSKSFFILCRLNSLLESKKKLTTSFITISEYGTNFFASLKHHKEDRLKKLPWRVKTHLEFIDRELHKIIKNNNSKEVARVLSQNTQFSSVFTTLHNLCSETTGTKLDILIKSLNELVYPTVRESRGTQETLRQE